MFVGTPHGRDYVAARWALLVTAVGLSVFVGCDCGEPVDLSEINLPVMDLEIGNTWYYESRANEPNAVAVEIARAIVEQMQITIEGDTISVAHEQVVARKEAGSLPGDSRLLRNEPDGLYCYGFVDQNGVAQVLGRSLVAPRNASKGDRYPIGPDAYLVCVDTDRLITLWNNRYRVDVFFYSLNEGTAVVPDVFVIPGVGLTRYYSMEFTETLVGYDFN